MGHDIIRPRSSLSILPSQLTFQNFFLIFENKAVRRGFVEMVFKEAWIVHAKHSIDESSAVSK
jgi:hypothetical protein